MAPLTGDDVDANEAEAISSGESNGCMDDLDIEESAAATLAAIDQGNDN